jgi:hypothetical protein
MAGQTSPARLGREVIDLAGMRWFARTCGALLVLLGAWGGLIPFVGPYFRYAFTPDHAWVYTSGRLWLEVLPALGTLAGGVAIMISALRSVVLAGSWLAAVSGGWFAVGVVLAPVWIGGPAPVQGTPAGAALARAVEQIGFFTGLGVAIVFVAALVLGRFSGIGFSGVKIAGRTRQVPAAAETGAGGEPDGSLDTAAG